MCGEERELEDGGHAVYRSWCVACVKDSCARKHLQVEPLEKEGRARTKPSLVPYDCVFLTQKNADATLECENETSLEVFQEVKIYSCVEVVVRITEDIPLLNGIPHFAMRFLNKIRNGRGWKRSVMDGETSAAWLLSRFQPGSADGTTAYARQFENPYESLMLLFGERAVWKDSTLQPAKLRSSSGVTLRVTR